MKYITELAEDEILLLNDSDLQTMIQEKMMEEGVKIIQKPTEPTYRETSPKDVTGYSVKIEGSSSLIFTSMGVAKEVADFLRTKVIARADYVSDRPDSYEKKLVEKENEITIEEEKYYSQELWDKIKEDKSSNSRIKEIYTKRLEEFEQSERDAQWIRDEVHNKYDEVDSKYRRLNESFEKFNEYLTLANNKFAEALKFYTKAYQPDQDTLEFIHLKHAKPFKRAEIKPEEKDEKESDADDTEE